MTDVHSTATVTLQAHRIEGFSVRFTIGAQLLEFIPLVSDHGTAAETTNWNNHDITSSVGLLLLAASATTKLVLGLFATWVVHKKTAVESKILVPEFFIKSFSAAVLVNKATRNCRSNGIGLSHDATAVGGH